MGQHPYLFSQVCLSLFSTRTSATTFQSSLSTIIFLSHPPCQVGRPFQSSLSTLSSHPPLSSLQTFSVKFINHNISHPPCRVCRPHCYFSVKFINQYFPPTLSGSQTSLPPFRCFNFFFINHHFPRTLSLCHVRRGQQRDLRVAGDLSLLWFPYV